MANLTTQTLSFSQEYIQPGHLAILFDRQNQIIGSGVILEVEPLSLKMALHMVGLTGAHRYEDDHQGFMEQLTPYDLQIRFVENGEIQLFTINPSLYEIGTDHASINS